MGTHRARSWARLGFTLATGLAVQASAGQKKETEKAKAKQEDVPQSLYCGVASDNKPFCFVLKHDEGQNYVLEAPGTTVQIPLTRSGHAFTLNKGEASLRVEFEADWNSGVQHVKTPKYSEDLKFTRATEQEAANWKTQTRKTQQTAEVRANLKASYTAQKAYFQEKDKYVPFIDLLGISPERGNRYSYYFASEGPSQVRTGDSLGFDETAVIVEVDRFKFPNLKFHATVAATGCHVTPGTDSEGETFGVGVSTGKVQKFLVLAAGQLEDEPGIDCWTVASVQRKAADGTTIYAGEPYHEPKN